MKTGNDEAAAVQIRVINQTFKKMIGHTHLKEIRSLKIIFIKPSCYPDH